MRPSADESAPRSASETRPWPGPRIEIGSWDASPGEMERARDAIADGPDGPGWSARPGWDPRRRSRQDDATRVSIRLRRADFQGEARRGRPRGREAPGDLALPGGMTAAILELSRFPPGVSCHRETQAAEPAPRAQAG